MEEFKIMTHEQFGRVRRVELEKVPWFVGRDVGLILGYARPEVFINKHVPFSDKQLLLVPSFDFSKRRKMTVVNERGIEAMLVSSPYATPIRQWLLGDKPAITPTSSHVIEIDGVRCLFDDQNILLNAEDCARGLGFVDSKFATCGENYVRWERVNEHLKEFGFKPVGKDDYICETAFYLLAMKANNKTAKNFQWKVANVILPAINKNGYYVSPKMANKNEEVIRLKKQYARPCADLAVVYALLMGNGTVKIGMTKDLTDRIKQIENETGIDVWDYATTPFMARDDAAALEERLKLQFSANNIGGEFFDVKFALVAAEF